MFGLFGKKDHIEEAHIKALDILKDIGSLETLAFLHKEALIGNTTNDEINDLVLGAYRTVGIGAGIGVGVMQKAGRPQDEIGKMYWAFMNESSIRQIASSMFESLRENITVQMPAEVMTREQELLLSIGIRVYSLYSEKNIQAASDAWLNGAKGTML